MTECTIERDRRTARLWVKIFLFCSYPASGASVNLWICKGEQPKSPEHPPLTETVLRCRFSLQRKGDFTSSLSLDWSLQPPPVVSEVWSAAQCYLFWEHWQWPRTGLAEVISLGFVSSLPQGVKTALSLPTVHSGKLWTKTGILL